MAKHPGLPMDDLKAPVKPGPFDVWRQKPDSDFYLENCTASIPL